MQSLIVGQVHDSILCDVPKDEVSEVLSLIREVMTERVRDHWSWIIVPMTVEAEASDKNWYEKEEIEFP